MTRKTPLIGLVGRLVEQKGIDLVKKAMPKLLEKDVQFVFLGTGEPSYERYFAKLASENPGRVSVKIGFDAAYAQQIYAGSDFFLMPSRFEPCGLGQLYALKYGTLPWCAQGGLDDHTDRLFPATARVRL